MNIHTVSHQDVNDNSEMTEFDSNFHFNIPTDQLAHGNVSLAPYAPVPQQ